jgi:hypothetical protein
MAQSGSGQTSEEVVREQNIRDATQDLKCILQELHEIKELLKKIYNPE